MNHKNATHATQPRPIITVVIKPLRGNQRANHADEDVRLHVSTILSIAEILRKKHAACIWNFSSTLARCTCTAHMLLFDSLSVSSPVLICIHRPRLCVVCL